MTAKVGPTCGQYQLTCSSTTGETVTDILWCNRVVPLNDGMFRLEFTRPGPATDGASRSMHVVADRRGIAVEGYCEPIEVTR